MPKKWVYLFSEVDQAEEYVGGEWENVRGLLGGKGANLAEMARIEVPVPPGFTITTEACNAYLASGEILPEGMWDQVLQAVADLEKESGKKFGDRKNPLLVSCRSGAKFSMPGMMDTVLNIGLNDETAKGLVELTGNERFVYDSFRRLIQIEREAEAVAKAKGTMLATGLNVSPGAAVGMVAFDADLAEMWAKEENKAVIMVRPETKPDDVHGMLAAQGILTSRGGRTSHAALVARQFGKPAVVGVSELKIDINKRQMSINDDIIKEGDWISIDGTAGEVYRGKIKTTVPDIMDPWLIKLLSWADKFRRLGVWTNADNPDDAQRARTYGAEGIGLCRTEHMFFEPRRLPYLHKMIMSDLPIERREALDALLPFQRDDFAGLFRAMDGLPVITRLIDPPLHEFLPNHMELNHDLTDLKIRLKHADTLEKVDTLLQQIKEKAQILKRVESLHESNPMLGLRGVRLGIQIPELTTMQVRAIFEAACMVTKEGVEVHPEIMIPLTSHVNELKAQREILEVEAKKVMREQGIEIDYKFGTMIEIPRAALTAHQLAEHAEFFSFGTNDLTQTTFGMSRDDAEAGFLIRYLRTGILPENPFATLDRDGVGELMALCVKKARSVNPELECGICGEHAGDPKSISFCHEIGLTYVSCSPYRVPVARLCAAQAALLDKTQPGKPGLNIDD